MTMAKANGYGNVPILSQMVPNGARTTGLRTKENGYGNGPILSQMVANGARTKD